MNASTALATVIVDELGRGGVRDVVLSPGSRSAPLALALHRADAEGVLRLHVRVDERGAGFLALGLARGTACPVPVVCTSGTAVANLHPSVLEAHHDGVPVVVLSADRPPELRGVGANQTTHQPGLFGSAVRVSVDIPAAEERPGAVAHWRSTVARVLLAARGAGSGEPGPVHLNVGFREPLLPDGGGADWLEPLGGRKETAAWTTGQAGSPAQAARPDRGSRLDRGIATLVVAGHGAGQQAARLAEEGDWPLLAEPTSGAWGSPQSVPAGTWLLESESFLAEHRPERVVVLGRPTLARSVTALLAVEDVEVVVVPGAGRQWPDPTRTAARLASAPVPRGRPRRGWAAEWRSSGAEAWLAVRDTIDAMPWPVEPGVARDLVAALPPGSTCFLGASQPVRDVMLAAAPRPGLHLFGNRGLSGIDGSVSTATGLALASGDPSYALLGDLAFLHDATGLVLGPAEPRPDLTVVVLNNNGGGIFGLLEQGSPAYADAFERVFGTPVDVDLAELCRAAGVRHDLIASAQALRDAVSVGRPGGGLRVLEVRTDRSQARTTHARLRAATAEALR